MNLADAQKIAAYYEKEGWSETSNPKKADEIIVVSCSVRQSAENRVYGFIHNLSKQNPQVKIILTGCMLRYPLAFLKKRLPQVSEFKPVSQYLSNQLDYLLKHKEKHAFVPIMEGCNNFCSYCVVPYARGREKSFPFEKIICQVQKLVDSGYEEITLLGQNVNSYGKDFSEEEKQKIISKFGNPKNAKRNLFALLIENLHKIKGLNKISFLTSNPWDLTDEIIEILALPKVDKYLHLPVQSGDDEILRKMNRKYTAADYLKLVEKIRQKVPEIKIGTDIIVGFPGETKEAFQNTVNLCQKVGFEKAYIAMYSPRPQTAAFKLEDDVPYQEKKRRWQILENLINQKYQSKIKL